MGLNPFSEGDRVTPSEDWHDSIGRRRAELQVELELLKRKPFRSSFGWWLLRERENILRKGEFEVQQVYRLWGTLSLRVTYREEEYYLLEQHHEHFEPPEEPWE